MPKWLQTGIRDTQIMYGKTVEKKYILPILFRIEEIK